MNPERLADAIHSSVAAAPDRTCLVVGEESITYAQLWDRAGALAQRLRDLGLGPGHKIAILSANSAGVLVAMVAIQRSGAAWLPVNHRDARSAVTEVLRRFECHALLVAPELAGEVEALRAAAPSLAVAVELDSGRELMARAVADADPADADLAAVFPTGGTTGVPKGVAYTHERLAGLMRCYRDVLASPGEVYLAAAPLTHVSGRISLGVLVSGGTVVLLPAFDPGAALRAVAEHRVTTITLVPTMLYRLLDHPEVGRFDTGSVRTLAVGGAPLPRARAIQAIEVFGPVLESVYGQTEAPLMIARMRPPEFHDRDGHLLDSRLAGVGRSTAASKVRIVDEDGRPLPAGSEGEICVRGDFTMSGYYRDPERTSSRRCGDYWRTGDIGVLDQDGYLTIVGRATDLIISGGFNIYPAEIENAAADLPGVAQCAAFGVPDPEWGEAVALAVVPHPHARPDADTVRRHLRERLGGVKAPKIVVLVDDLPRNENGKVVKAELARLHGGPQ